MKLAIFCAMCLLLLLATHPLWAHVAYQPGAANCSSHPCTLAVTCPTDTCAATDIQTAINAAVGGDTITIQAGVVWTSTGNITLKSGMASTVTIRTSTDDSLLPASGTRITPAYSALLPNIQLTGSSLPLFRVEPSANQTKNYSFLGIQFSSAQNLDSAYALFETWYAPQGSGHAFTDASNTSPIRLTMASTAGLSNGDHVIVQGLTGNTAANGWWTISNVTATTVDLDGSTGNGTFQKGPLVTTPMISTNAIYDVSQMPDSISFDRCLFIGAPLSGIRQGIRLAGSNLTVKNSYCDGIKAQADSQCISMPSTPGPVTITNNFLGGGSGETVITGGAVPNLAGPDGTGQNATDVAITHNAFYKDPALYKYETWGATMWVRKGKVIDGGNGYRYIAVTSGVTGSSVPALPTSVCSAPPVCSGGCCVTDGTVTWERNYFVNSTKWTFKNLLEFKNGDRVTVKWNSFDGAWPDGQSGVALLINTGAQGYIGPAKSVHVEFGYNVIRHASTFLSANSGQDYGDGILQDLNIHNNLFIEPVNAADTSLPTLNFAARINAPPCLTGLQVTHNTVKRSNTSRFLNFPNDSGKVDAPVIKDNLFEMSGIPYPVWCAGCPLTGAKNVLDAITNGLGTYTFAKNVIADENLSKYPIGNYNTAWASIGFTNPNNREFTLASSSLYKNAGTDGKDLGADSSQLPQIRNLTIRPTSTQVTLSWNVTAPVQSIPCVAEVATDASFSTYVPDLDPTLYIRPDVAAGTGTLSRSITIGTRWALIQNTAYAYRLHCGGAFEYGQFTAAADVASLSSRATTMTSGTTDSMLTVWLTAAAPVGGTIVTLGSSNPALLSVPTSVTVPAGASWATVSVTAGRVATATNVVVQGTVMTTMTATIQVVPPMVTHFTVTAPTAATTAAAFSFGVNALDAGNNLVTGYTGTVHFSSSDSTATLPADATLTNGSGTFQATLRSGGSRTITAADTANSTIAGTSGAISVNVPVTHFTVTAPTAATAAAAFSFGVNALDAGNNLVTGYTGTVHFSSSDSTATLPADATLTNGSGTFHATLRSGGSRTITAADAANATIAGTSGVISVNVPVTHFTVTAPTAATTAEPFGFAVYALDADNNLVTGYTGTVHFSSSDNTATLPANATLTNGSGTFQATLRSGGSRTITAADAANATIAGTSGVISVNVPVTHFTVTAPTAATTAEPFGFAVYALDADNNLVTGYTGTVHFSSSDSTATLPANATLTSGSDIFQATLRSGGSRTITAADTANSTIAGTSGVISVNVPITHFTVMAPIAATAAAPFGFAVYALDAGNNLVTGYTGAVHFSSSDSTATLPANARLTNGSGIFQATLRSGGSRTITAADAANATIAGTSGVISVNVPVTHFTVMAPIAATAAAPFGFAVYALDAGNNLVTGYTGTVHFSSSDNTATLPVNATLTNGSGTFQATLRSGGSRTITAADAANATIAGTSGGISVNVPVTPPSSQSLRVTSAGGAGYVSFSLPNSAPWTTIAGSPGVSTSQPMRWELRVHDVDSSLNQYAYSVGFGVISQAASILGFAPQVTTWDGVTRGQDVATVGTDITIRVQRDVANSRYTFEACSVATGICSVDPSFSAIAKFSDPSLVNQDWYVKPGRSVAFIRWYSSVVPLGTPIPLAGTGDIANWDFTSGVADSVRGLSFSTVGDAAITYVSTPTYSDAVPPMVTHFSITAPESATPGAAFSFAVSALDAGNNLVTGYTGTVHFSSSDSAATLPANATLTNGSGIFQATLRSIGSQTITAADAANSTIAGAGATVQMISAPVDVANISSATTITSGATGLLTVWLTAAAPVGGTIVTLSSSNAALLSVPASVTVPAGKSQVSVWMTARTATTPTNVVVQGTVVTTKGATIQVVSPPDIQYMDVLPTYSGGSAAITLYLTSAAQAGGVAVTLTSSNPSAFPLPARVVIPAGANRYSVPITVGVVSATTSITVQGKVIRTVTRTTEIVPPPSSVAKS